MARDFQVNGESLVQVKGRSHSNIATLTSLGLSEKDGIRISPQFKHFDVTVDAWGEAPAEIQWMLAEVQVTMQLVHIDRDVLDVCIQESMGGPPVIAGVPIAVGAVQRAGSRLGNGLARFADSGTGLSKDSNHFIEMSLTSPIQGKPWRFYTCFLARNPVEIPIGVKRSVFSLTWRCLPYATDPYGAGLGASGVVIWDHVAAS